MTKQNIVKVTCDGCSAEIKDHSQGGYATIRGRDYCPACLKELHSEVDVAHHRVVLGEVRDRRGGYRKLGDFADT